MDALVAYLVLSAVIGIAGAIKAFSADTGRIGVSDARLVMWSAGLAVVVAVIWPILIGEGLIDNDG